MTVRQVTGRVAATLADALRDRGFRRHGLKLVRADSEMVALLELQLRRSGTAEEGAFVVNAGIVLRSLFEGSNPELPWHTECQWRERVSDESGREIWWPVRENDSAHDIAARVLAALERDILPRMDVMRDERSFVDLWISGRGSGLTEMQQLLYLGRLLHRAGRREEFFEVRAELEQKGFIRAVLALDELKW